MSRDAYLAYYKRARPAWARIWCEAIEADLMSKVTVKDGGRLEFHHDDELMNRIYKETWSCRNPEYDRIEAPMLAVVPDGGYHQSVPLDATEELGQAANEYWRDKILPWIRQRTAVFLQAVPTARVVRLDTPYHHIFLAAEDDTVAAITDFLASGVA